jgi:glycerol kinase
MDSIPIRTVPVPTADALKIAEPDTKIQHVEHVNAPANIEHHEHLPKGISETVEEKKARWFIGSIDCGTTSSRFLIFDGEGTPIASHQIEFENIYPESGYVLNRLLIRGLGANLVLLGGTNTTHRS